MISLHDLAVKHNAKKDAPCLELYADAFETIRGHQLNILEMGVQGGGSLKMWSEFFPNSRVVGIDFNDVSTTAQAERVQFFQGRQEDRGFLQSVCELSGIDKFDIIIDDASHFALYTKMSYDILFDDHLKRGGFYIIEDWGTGFWDEWPDGSRYQIISSEQEISGRESRFVYRPDEATGLLPKLFASHQFGMVGFVKQLVDEAHYGAIRNVEIRRPSKFKQMIVKEQVVMITKL